METHFRRGWTTPIALLGLCTALLTGLFTSAAGAVDLQSCSVQAESLVLDGEEQAMVQLVNSYRVANGQRALTLSTDLSRAAAWMAGDMASKGYFSHTDSLGRDPFRRSTDCGYPVPAGENLAAGTQRDTAPLAFALLKSSPPHDQNMLAGIYFQIGVARVYNPDSQYHWYWVQSFGTVDDRPAEPSPPAPPAPEPSPSAAHATQGANQPASTTLTSAPPPPAGNSAAATDERPTFIPDGNAVEWTGPEMNVWEVAGLAGGRLEAVYAFDQSSRTWRHTGPALPRFASTLRKLEPGGTYWFVISPPVQGHATPEW